ncbi:MAG: DUF1588 domain-containing protein [Lentisphaerales bacterium]|nr:DUF1588 domain-containing protein [Lentisphaerales bacterium]
MAEKIKLKKKPQSKAKVSIKAKARETRKPQKSGFGFIIPLIMVSTLSGALYFAFKFAPQDNVVKVEEQKKIPKLVKAKPKKEIKAKPKKEIIKEAVKSVEIRKIPKMELPDEKLFFGDLTHLNFNQILKDKCVNCHGAEGKEVEGDFNIAKVMNSRSLDSKGWAKIYRSIDKGEMPPSKEDDPESLPLEVNEKDFLLASMKSMFDGLKETASTRVLTPYEFENTLVDLFDIRLKTYNPFGKLYSSYSENEFHTHQRRVLSPYFLTEVYNTLYDVLKSFVALKPQQDKMNLKVRFKGHPLGGPEWKDRTDLRWPFRPHQIEFKNLDPKVESTLVRTDGDNNTEVNDQLEKLSLPPGTYKLTFEARAENLDLAKVYPNEYGQQTVDFLKGKLDRDGEQAYSLPVKFLRTAPGTADAFGANEIIKELEIDSYEGTQYSFEFTLDRRSGLGFQYNFKNNHQRLPIFGKLASLITSHVHGDDFDLKQREAIQKKYLRIKDYIFPMVTFKNLKIEGPYDVKVHPLSFDQSSKQGDLQLREKFRTLHNTLNIKNNTIYNYVFSDFKKEKMTYEDSYRNAMIMFFMSPQFLTVNSNKKDPLYKRFASYSLLKSSLSNDFNEVYDRAKVTRDYEGFGNWLLKNKKFERFVKAFSYQWLEMGHIKHNAPDPADYGIYYANNLGDAYKVELEHFIINLFLENRPVTDLVTADYSFLNDDLENYYKNPHKTKRYNDKYRAPAIKEEEFTKRSLFGTDRGGLLTMGAFLTATGNGAEPLPLKRAAWISKNLFDSPLSAPPDIDSDNFEKSTKAKTLGERLTVHAQSAACYNCHKRLDPMAILMDRYNTMGGINSHFHKESVKINDKTLTDVNDLKSHLASHPDVIARAFSKSLLSFMLGRDTGVQDETRLDMILDKVKRNGYRAGDIYKQLVFYYFF